MGVDERAPRGEEIREGEKRLVLGGVSVEAMNKR